MPVADKWQWKLRQQPCARWRSEVGAESGRLATFMRATLTKLGSPKSESPSASGVRTTICARSRHSPSSNTKLLDALKQYLVKMKSFDGSWPPHSQHMIGKRFIKEEDDNPQAVVLNWEGFIRRIAY